MKKPHTFAICAYGDSPFLGPCIRSLKAQSEPSPIIVCTSTPSPYITALANAYQIPVYVREGESDIQADWNFAYRMADADYVTIAHQDDLYQKDYSKLLLAARKKYPDMTVFTGGYLVVKNGRLARFEKVEFIKRFLRLPLRLKPLCHLKAVKMSALRFGNAICCPACAYHKTVLGEELFHSPFRFALDWDTLWELAKRKGRFICVERPILYYRVHEGAATKASIQDESRAREETLMFNRLWPEPVARILMRFYCKAYDQYEI